MKTIFFDTETISLLDKFEDDDILFQICFTINDNIYSDYFRPETFMEMVPEAMAKTGITPEILERKYKKEDSKEFNILKELLESDEKKLLIAHNMNFDKEVLRRSGIKFNNTDFICTLKLVEFINDNLGLQYEKTNLQYLKYYLRLDKNVPLVSSKFNIDVSELLTHDARYDVVDLICLFSYLKNQYSINYYEMIKITNDPFLLKYVPFGINKGKKFTELTENQLNYYKDFDGNIGYTCKEILKG